MPMPVDVYIYLKDSTTITYTIPLDIMRGAKNEIGNDGEEFHVLPDWDWVNPLHEIVIPYVMENIDSVSIDASRRMADMIRANNNWPRSHS